MRKVFKKNTDDTLTRIKAYGEKKRNDFIESFNSTFDAFVKEDVRKFADENYNINSKELNNVWRKFLASSNLEKRLQLSYDREWDQYQSKVQDILMESEEDLNFSMEFGSLSNVKLKKVVDASKMIKQGSARVVSMSFTDGAASLTKVASSSGTQMHKIVLNVGHFFGTKFKPWGAVKIANNIGRVASFAGPVLAIADVAVTVGSKIAEEKELKQIQEAKKSSFNSISSIASDLNSEIDKQYALMEAEAFDKKITEINNIKESMVKEAGENNDFVNLLRGYGEEIKALLNSLINSEESVAG